jgi:colanic acid/amylovoran biosynthesis glycosyltransferase
MPGATPEIARDTARDQGDRPLVVGYVLKMFPRLSETFILNEILALERRDVRVVVFSIKAPNESVRQLGVTEVRAPLHVIPPWRGRAIAGHLYCHARCLLRAPRRYVRTLVFALGRRSRTGWKRFLAAPFIVCTARAAGVEHFHAHFASAPARQAKFASLLSGVPYSFTAHAKDLYWHGHQHGVNNKLKKRVRLASHVITISERNRHFIEGLGFKIPRRRLVTVYNGLDLREWPHLRPDGRPCAPRDDGLLTILAVGRLVEKKGFHVLIEGCARLRAQGVAFRCVIAGEGPQRERLTGMIRAAGLSDCVELVGSIRQDQLREDLYLSATLLAQPSVVGADGDQDGIPTVILEAMALGLPVVATDVSGIGEAVVDGESGLLVPADDAQALAEAIARLSRDPQLAAALARGARRMAETRFDLCRNVRILIHLMTSAARRRPRWSNQKLQERARVAPSPDGSPDEVGDEIPAQG